jgi:hypothetical protein
VPILPQTDYLPGSCFREYQHKIAEPKLQVVINPAAIRKFHRIHGDQKAVWNGKEFASVEDFPRLKRVRTGFVMGRHGTPRENAVARR